MKCRFFSLSLLLIHGVTAVADDKAAVESPVPPPSIENKIAGLETLTGFFTIFPDHKLGTVWLEIDKWDEDFLYASGLSSGLGSNPVGLDRGQWGASRVVRFKRVGNRAYLIEQNLRYRAVTADPAERQAVDDSFADSVIWAANIAAQTGDRCLVDLGSLLVSDTHKVVNKLRSTDQGDFKLDQDRSFVEIDRCRSFPRNSELEAMLTFSSDNPGPLVRQASASGDTFSLRLHHSLVKLPEPGYLPRRAHPSVGSFNITYADYAAPLDAPLTQRFITRHRLQKADPSQDKSPPIEPITYYLDPGTPQPIRDALLDGARWWAAGFEDAGFVDAYQVLMLPEGADPMDVRYNVIQWVHRSTRGWSYGQSIVDPRTGEIIKGHVLLGSLRVRQDRLIIDGLTSTQETMNASLCHGCGIAGAGASDALAQLDRSINPLEVSLARLRQLSAHEVGHTLGFSHNFAASTYGDRASVMDYPAPRVQINEGGKLDLSDAYGVGLGAWDRFMVRYAYSNHPDEESEANALADLINEARDQHLIFLSDADARPMGAAHPLANLWDNGSDPIAELEHVMKVRQLALAQLEADDLLDGEPLADLEMVLVPVYLYHRYQVAATAKLIGGFDYHYASQEDRRTAVEPISIERQKQAVDALLKTLGHEVLVIPQRLLRLLPPKPFASVNDRERFSGRTAMIFDPSSAAQAAAELTVSQLLQPQRLARLAAYPESSWHLRHLLDQIVHASIEQPVADDVASREVQRIVQHVVVQHLIALAGDPSTSDSVRAVSEAKLQEIANDYSAEVSNANTLGDDHISAIRDRINRFLTRPHTPTTPPRSVPPPPGSPIGL